MHFLDARGPLVRYAEVDIAVAQEFADPAAALAGERHDGISCSCAAPIASITLPELPEVEIASSTSPRRPSARTCLAKTCSNE